MSLSEKCKIMSATGINGVGTITVPVTVNGVVLAPVVRKKYNGAYRYRYYFCIKIRELLFCKYTGTGTGISLV